MDFTIVHEVPGRIRVRCQSVRTDTGTRIELRRWVSRHPALVSASLSARTGNLLIMYDKSVNREDILALVGELRFFEVATLSPAPSRDSVRSCLGESIQGVLVKESCAAGARLLPRPVQGLLTGWRSAMRLMLAVESLAARDFAHLALLAVKSAVFSLFSWSLPCRILFRIGMSWLERTFFSAPTGYRQPVPIPYRLSQAAG